MRVHGNKNIHILIMTYIIRILEHHIYPSKPKRTTFYTIRLSILEHVMIDRHHVLAHPVFLGPGVPSDVVSGEWRLVPRDNDNTVIYHIT